MENYRIVRELGRGATADVFLVRHRGNHKLFALKRITVDETKPRRNKDKIGEEAAILACLKHPNIVMLRQSFFHDNTRFLCIVQDYCDGGTLHDRIQSAKDHGDRFTEYQTMEWFVQIIMALQYIHSKKILHRYTQETLVGVNKIDLKPENVFIRKTLLKIGDFGISRKLEHTIDMAKTHVGTPSYLSPELCLDEPYTNKADMWAAGCLLYELCMLEPAFSACNIISLFFKIAKAEYHPVSSSASEKIKELVESILVQSADERPSASTILQFPFVRENLLRMVKEKQTNLRASQQLHQGQLSVIEEVSMELNSTNNSDKYSEDFESDNDDEVEYEDDFESDTEEDELINATWKVQNDNEVDNANENVIDDHNSIDFGTKFREQCIEIIGKNNFDKLVEFRSRNLSPSDLKMQIEHSIGKEHAETCYLLVEFLNK